MKIKFVFFILLTLLTNLHSKDSTEFKSNKQILDSIFLATVAPIIIKSDISTINVSLLNHNFNDIVFNSLPKKISKKIVYSKDQPVNYFIDLNNATIKYIDLDKSFVKRELRFNLKITILEQNITTQEMNINNFYLDTISLDKKELVNSNALIYSENTDHSFTKKYLEPLLISVSMAVSIALFFALRSK